MYFVCCESHTHTTIIFRVLFDSVIEHKSRLHSLAVVSQGIIRCIRLKYDSCFGVATKAPYCGY